MNDSLVWRERLDDLARACAAPGWCDGEGEAVTAVPLALAAAFHQHADAFWPGHPTLDAYPTPEGFIQLEWVLWPWICTVAFQRDGRSRAHTCCMDALPVPEARTGDSDPVALLAWFAEQHREAA